jgi:PAS domain S-box-containing protein
MAAPPITVLLVEDNPGDARLILELLGEVQAQAFDLERVDRLDRALTRLARTGVDVVLLDLGLPDSQGLDTFVRARRGAPNEPIVVISGLDDERVALEAVRSGAQDYLVKGRIEGQLLARVLRYAIERKRAEEALREREAYYRTILEHIGDAVFIAAPDSRYLDVNPRACELTGYSREELLRLRISDTYAAEERAAAAALVSEVATGRPVVLERSLVRKDGTVLTVESNARRLPDGRLLGAVRDITERKKLEDQLRQAQKLEAVGRLAGGVAHDFNNVLTAIFGYVDLVLEDVPAGSPPRQDLEEIRKAAERAAGLTRQLLAFSRQQVLQPVVLNVTDVVQDIDKMVRRLVGEDVAVRLNLASDVGNVRTDPGQLQQVIMNLVVNARDAMPTGGKLLIETDNADLTEQYAELHQPVTPGRYVMLAVSDTGTGMTAETRARIFEPFFTTKEKGRGTGLGLSTVYGIVKQSGGYIWVYSEPGRGTTFKIYLPRVDAPAEPVAAPREAGTLAGTETILLAEDDAMLRPLTKGLLERLGYTVLEAENAHQALAATRAHGGPIHLLVADVVMPGPSGRDLARRLTESRPDTKVLYVSGYTDDAIVQHGMLEPGLNFLQKPFTPAALARKVREVLDAT